MSFFEPLLIGLPKPKDDAEELRMLTSMDALRQEIRRYSYQSTIIHDAFAHAEHRGLSGEDKYVLLAYHALRRLEETHRRLIRVLDVMPNLGPITVNDGKS